MDGKRWRPAAGSAVMSGFTAVDMRHTEDVAGGGPAVHRCGQTHEPRGPRHVRAHVERHDLVADVMAAGEAGRHRVERRAQLVPTSLGRTDRGEQTDGVVVRPHLQSRPHIAADQGFFRLVLPMRDQRAEGLKIGHAASLTRPTVGIRCHCDSNGASLARSIPTPSPKEVCLDGEPVNVSRRAFDALAAKFEAPVLRAGDAGFDEATTIWNGIVTSRPAVVVQPVSAGEVREAIGFARANGILLSIKGGGHNIAGTSLAGGGLTLDMSRLRWVEVDHEHRIAQVGPGCLLGDVDRATQAHGLATVLGFISLTGVAGLTLGGGFGYLSRQFGWTVVNLDEVEIVTADGQIRRAAADEHEDLFWALRGGGGGNFGAVTRFSFGLHEIGPLITGGLIAWDAEQAEDVAAHYQEMCEAAPRELTLHLLAQPRQPALAMRVGHRRGVGKELTGLPRGPERPIHLSDQLVGEAHGDKHPHRVRCCDHRVNAGILLRAVVRAVFQVAAAAGYSIRADNSRSCCARPSRSCAKATASPRCENR
jgi:hypothetical protein